MLDLEKIGKISLILLFLITGFNVALAQQCVDELSANLSDEMLAEKATGRVAARLFKQAVELLEPAMPPFNDTYITTLNPDDPDYPVVKYLADRQILPETWQDGELDPQVWRAMLLKVVMWYDILPVSISHEGLNNQQLIDNLSILIDRASETINPLVLAGVNSRQDSNFSFLSILRNDPPYPRLIVVKPSEEIDVSQNFESIFAHVGNCASKFSNYVYGPGPAARQLFLTHNRSIMYVFKTDSTGFESWIEVPQGQEVTYLEFINSDVADLSHYTALFNGSGPNIFTLMQVVPQFRTNMSPRAIINFVQAIPR